MDQQAQEAVEKVDLCCNGCELFRIAKQKVGEEKDATWVTCLKDETETMKVSVDDQKKIWKNGVIALMLARWTVQRGQLRLKRCHMQ